MAKITITESDIKHMVLDGVKKLFEAIKYGTASGTGVWEPSEVFTDSGLDDDEIDAMVRRYPQIEWNGYTITAKVSSTEYSGEDGPGNVASHGDDKEFGGDYDKAVADISQLTNPVLKNKLTQSLNNFCESLEMEDFEESYPEDYMDLEENTLNEHDPDDRDYGQVEDWRMEQAYKSLIKNGRRFDSIQDFITVNHNMDLDLHLYETYLMHSDIPLLNNGVTVIFYPGSITYESDDRGFGGFVVEDVGYVYGDEETCSVEGKITKLEPGLIGWLDKGVDAYIDSHYDEIINHFYGN